MASAATRPAKPRLVSSIYVLHIRANKSPVQSLKETFASKLPAEIEKIKKLRKYVSTSSS
jgi:hypothetical protein